MPSNPPGVGPLGGGVTGAGRERKEDMFCI
jgi:hypothetical protein